MAKDIPFENLKGFVRKGARAKNKGFVSTGHFNLDFAIKYGMPPSGVDLNDLNDYDPSRSLGLPLGRIVELFGAEAGGKSSLAYRVCGFAQKMGLTAAWIDTEHSFEEGLATLNGCDVDELLYSELYDEDNPDRNFFAEDIMDNIIELCKQQVARVIVLDSVANLVPREVDEKNAEQLNIAKLARILSAQLGKVSHHANKNNVLVIFINQLREKPGVMFGPSETTPGGRSLKHNASVRLQITKRSKADAAITIDDDESPDGKRLIGRYSYVVIAKNRMGPPCEDASGKKFSLDVPVYYRPYFPDIEERMFDLGRQLQVIAVRKDIYKWDEHKIAGRKGFIEHIKSKNLQSDLLAVLKQTAKDNSVVLPPEIVQAEFDQKAVDNEQKESVSRPRKAEGRKVSTANA